MFRVCVLLNSSVTWISTVVNPSYPQEFRFKPVNYPKNSNLMNKQAMKYFQINIFVKIIKKKVKCIIPHSVKKHFITSLSFNIWSMETTPKTYKIMIIILIRSVWTLSLYSLIFLPKNANGVFIILNHSKVE